MRIFICFYPSHSLKDGCFPYGQQGAIICIYSIFGCLVRRGRGGKGKPTKPKNFNFRDMSPQAAINKRLRQEGKWGGEGI